MRDNQVIQILTLFMLAVSAGVTAQVCKDRSTYSSFQADVEDPGSAIECIRKTLEESGQLKNRTFYSTESDALDKVKFGDVADDGEKPVYSICTEPYKKVAPSDNQAMCDIISTTSPKEDAGSAVAKRNKRALWWYRCYYVVAWTWWWGWGYCVVIYRCFPFWFGK